MVPTCIQELPDGEQHQLQSQSLLLLLAPPCLDDGVNNINHASIFIVVVFTKLSFDKPVKLLLFAILISNCCRESNSCLFLRVSRLLSTTSQQNWFLVRCMEGASSQNTPFLEQKGILFVQVQKVNTSRIKDSEIKLGLTISGPMNNPYSGGDTSTR